AALHVCDAASVIGCKMYWGSASLLVIPPAPMLRAFPGLATRVNWPAVLLNVTDLTPQLKSRFGFSRVVPAKITSDEPSNGGTWRKFQLGVSDQLLVLPPPCHTDVAAKAGAAVSSAAILTASMRGVFMIGTSSWFLRQPLMA